MALDAIERVITMRNALKAGKNLPIRAYSDNAFILVNEAKPFEYTKWDDKNGVVYVFRLMSFHDTTNPSNLENSISVSAILYEYIQAMEVAPMPLDSFDDIITSMKGEGITFNNQFVEEMKHTFESALNKNRVTFDNLNKNAILGVKVKDESDEYYRGHFKEPFKETREKAEYNAYVDKVNSENP